MNSKTCNLRIQITASGNNYGSFCRLNVKLTGQMAQVVLLLVRKVWGYPERI